MRNPYRSLLLIIAGATHRELARQVKYLKVENEILRSRLPGRVFVTPKERNRLVKFAANLKAKALRQIVSIVHPDTLLRWVRDGRKSVKSLTTKRGRPATAAQIRNLILKFARENGWGYTRILGELKKLGINCPSRNTVKAILLQAGYDPAPRRGEGTWDEFIRQHAASLWQCDFFSRNVLTPKGVRQAFVLVFLNIRTRRVILSPASYRPDATWVETQAATFVSQAREDGLPVAYVVRDRDAKFSAVFDEALRRSRVKVVKTPYRSPNMNAFVERFIQSIAHECLNHFLIFGERHLNHLCREFLAHYHTERPHQGKDNELLIAAPKQKRPPASDEPPPLSAIRCHSRLGGLLKSYHRRAA